MLENWTLGSECLDFVLVSKCKEAPVLFSSGVLASECFCVRKYLSASASAALTGPVLDGLVETLVFFLLETAPHFFWLTLVHMLVFFLDYSVPRLT